MGATLVVLYERFTILRHYNIEIVENVLKTKLIWIYIITVENSSQNLFIKYNLNLLTLICNSNLSL